MSEAAGDERAAPTLSAGLLLRQARKAQGLHVAALAASLKVTPQKIEALENDRFDELPDAAFARALAQSVCRVLRTDPQPVLERLPQGISHRLERLEGGLNQPFRARAGAHHAEPRDASWLKSPAVWGPALLVMGAIVLLVAPFDFARRDAAGEGTGADGALPLPPSAASAAAPHEPASVAAPVAAAVEAPQAFGPQPANPTAGDALVVRTSEPSWIEARDAQGRVLVARTLAAGEELKLEGELPLKVRVGNARGTQLVFRGETIDAAATTRDNIARLEFK